MDFYFTDRSWHLLGIATAGEGPIHIVNDTDDQLISAGARTYSGTILFTPETSAKVKAMAAYGNYVLYKDTRGKAVFMTIMESNHDPLLGETTFTAEDAGIDLINETVGPYKADKPMSIAEYINFFVTDSGFDIGLNEIPDLKRTLEWTGESDTALARILSVATQFDHAELEFSFQLNGTSVVQRLINIHKRIGADKRITLYVDKDINKIVTSGNIWDLYTAITPTGGTPEAKDGDTSEQKPITLAGYQWTDPDGRFVLTSDGVLLDPVANQQWSRLLSGGARPDAAGAYINRVVTYTATSQATLLQSALSDLKAHNHEAVNYETDIAVLPQNINIGDTIHLADEDEHLYLSARLLELKSSYSTDTHTATLGDYLIEHDQVAAQYRQLAEQIKNLPKTVQYYPWIRYADDDQGTNMSAFPADKKYMAIVPNAKTSVPSDDPADYAGKWALIQGPQGSDGKGSYTHVAYANSIDGKTDFSTTNGNGKMYLGIYVDQTQVDSTDPTKYSWALFKGTDGRDGKDGSDNVPVITVGAAYPSGPKKGDMHWLTDSSGVVTGYYTYDGTKWNPYKIDAKILSAETFNGMTFNGVTFTGSKFISSFKGVKPDGVADYTVHGTTTMADGKIVTDTYSDTDNSQVTHTELSQFGLLSQIYNKGTLMDSAQLSLGMLTLSGNYQTASNKPLEWISSSLDALRVLQLTNNNLLVWHGVLYPQSGDTATISTPLSKTLSGWLIAWSYYQNGAPTYNNYAFTLIPKAALIYNTTGANYMRVTLTMKEVGTIYKFFYYDDTHIVGDDENATGYQAKAVMTEVYAV
ncbi:phage tail protein [Lacticaseibacillus paracasei]|nr:phage tail protein [Lacticaseibacillus paracasei]WBS98782.1 phage tail protein [Lacticaseibacillus paracasei]